MANWSDHRTTAAPITRTPARDMARDEGLRSYMLSVYNYMASGVLLTGIVALLFSWGGDTSPAAAVFYQPGILKYAIIFSPLIFVMVLSFGINRLSTGAAQGLFWAFAAIMGLSMSTIFLRYTGPSIALTFFATTAAFLSLSLYGYTTKRDLTGFGTFLIMGLVGLIVASVLNLFFQSGMMSMIISGIGVLLFAGLTAYDTQRIKGLYYQVAGTDFAGKAVIMGALSLYLDFVNMFQFLLSFLGNRD